VLGEISDVLPLEVELATMTGNVAQHFVTDEAWRATLLAARAALVPGGHLVFETRDPAAKAWLEWTRDTSHRQLIVRDVGAVEAWCEVLDARGTLVTFRWHFVFEADGVELSSDSTLRFRGRAEIIDTLAAVGFTIDEIRGAPDRPGLELVFVARRAAA
jgi:hypothetical protein